MKLSDLLSECHIYFEKEKLIDHLVNKIETHSKNIKTGDCFVAIRGYTHDGHDFIESVIEKGCQTIIFENPYYALKHYPNVNMIQVYDTKKVLALLSASFNRHPSREMHVVGITGTNGKTTIASVIHNIYTLLNEKATLMGTNGIVIDEEQFPTVNTTPNSPIIHQLLRHSKDHGIEQAVLEVSSHAVKEQRISQVDFDAMIYTNFSLDHLDYHKTVDDYFYNKALSFSYLGNHYQSDKFALINGDDEYADRFMNVSQVRTYTYGLKEHNHFRASGVVCNLNEIAFDLLENNQIIGRFKTNKLFGFYNMYNLLAALSYFRLRGADLKRIKDILPHLNKVTGRFEKVDTKHPLHVFIDFAHTPKGVYKLLQEVKLISDRAIITVIGCGGNRDESKRPLIGKIATSLSTFTIFTDDNPRFEKSEAILNDILRGVVNNHFLTIPDRKAAIHYAIQTANENDLILILGKGHENEQIINGVHYPFNDYEEAVQAINKRYMEE